MVGVFRPLPFHLLIRPLIGFFHQENVLAFLFFRAFFLPFSAPLSSDVIIMVWWPPASGLSASSLQVTALCRLTFWLFVIHCLHASVFLAHGRTRIHAACIMNEVALSQYPHYLPPLFLSHLSFLCDIPISTSTSILLS